MTDTPTPTALRLALRSAGYAPIPVTGKIPPMKKWQQVETTEDDIAGWGARFPGAKSTGILTRRAPALDIDITHPEAADDVEALIRERLEDRGRVLVRFGKPPKRAILLRTEAPFKKIVANLIGPDGSEQKIELLGDGQQVVCYGIHKDTQRPYSWHGGEPRFVARDELPDIIEAEARDLVEAAARLLVERHGYSRVEDRPKSNGQDASGAGANDWQYLFDAIREGRSLHDALRDLAAKMIRAGMAAGAVVNTLRALMLSSATAHDARWQERYDDIPRLVDSAVEKDAAAAAGPPRPIDDVLAVFTRWLVLPDTTPVLAVLGAVAANYLDGDPVWLGLIAPPSSAKTEILNSTALLPHVVSVATVTPPGLLSGTPKKQHATGAKGGLLRQIGDFGIIVLKDFGSVISMHSETRAETLAALREVYDGAWTRHLGTDGGRTLSWAGKVGLVFAATGVIDSHHAVIGAMGDRFLLSRWAPTQGEKQFERALEHVGATTKQMRKELAEAVAQLFAGRREPRPISKDEAKRIGAVISLAVRLRGAVARDIRTREIEAIYGAEGTARIGLALERLLAGLDTLGVDRNKALAVVESVALDSVPPLRRAAYGWVCKYKDIETGDVAIEMGLPTVTVRRILEDLAAYGLISRSSQGDGKSHIWNRATWEI
jgi:hypothetical protein